MKRIHFILFVSTLLITLISCSSGSEIDDIESETVVDDLKSFRAIINSVTDHPEIGGAAGVTLNVDGGTSSAVSEYRIFYVTSRSISKVNVERVLLLPENQVSVVPATASNFDFSFPIDQLGFQGSPMSETHFYVAIALSIVENEDGSESYVLSAPSHLFQIANDNLVVD